MTSILQTRRLRGERLQERALPDLVALHLDEEVMRHLGGVRSPKETAEYLAANVDHWDRHGFGLWVVRLLDGQFAGRVGIRHITIGGIAEVEVSYTFRRSLWCRGLATEALGFLVDFGFNQRRLPSLAGVASIGNAASRRVMEGAGFAVERQLSYSDEEVALYRKRAAGGSDSEPHHVV